MERRGAEAMDATVNRKSRDLSNVNGEYGGGGGGGDGSHLQQQQQRKEETTPLMVLNHVSRLCRSVDESRDFYKGVLGFVEMERPEALDFDGAWLFNYGIGVHLVQAGDEDQLPSPDDAGDLDPMDNHISFQCTDMEAVEQKLKDRNIKYIKRTLGDHPGSKIDQLFFNDPDGFMIEICSCENLKLVPQGSLGKIKLPPDQHNPPIEIENGGSDGVGD